MRKRLLLSMLLTLPVAAQTEVHSYVNRGYARAIGALRSAEQGDPISQYDFALMCERGEGMARNHREAMKWLRLSASQGYAPAQLFLGFIYASVKNFPEARKWLRRAADQGDGIARTYLEAPTPLESTPPKTSQFPRGAGF